MEGIRKEVGKRRAIVSTFFFTVVVGQSLVNGLAGFYETTSPNFFSKANIYGAWFCMIIFLTILLRFFIGNILHMQTLEEKIHEKSQFLWPWDFCVISLEFCIIFFMSMCFGKGCLTTIFRLIMLLAIVDVVWILCNVALGLIGPSFKRPFIPWTWLWLNVATVITMIFILPFNYEHFLKTRSLFNLPTIIYLVAFFLLCAAMEVVQDYYFVTGSKKGWRGISNLSL